MFIEIVLTVFTLLNMEAFLPISYLNDFIFCPYSIYLHQVFDSNKEEVYSAAPQQRGKGAHGAIDTTDTPKPSILKGIYVISNKLGVYGKIDTLHVGQQRLTESKFQISKLYQGYYYQLWAQYFALAEMGYTVSEIRFYSISDHKVWPVSLPGDAEFEELRQHIRTIARFDFDAPLKTNPAKCSHCIYAALCDKTNSDHVYA